MSFRRSASIALATLVAAASTVLVLITGAVPASAACPTPTFAISPSQGAPGDAIQISGQNWYRACPDGVNATKEPDSNIKIMFVQGSSATLIGTAFAGSDGRIEGQVFAPKKATTGEASVRAEGTNGQPSAPFRVVGGAATTTTAPTASTTSTTGGTTTTTLRSSTTTTEAPIATSTTVDVTTTLPEPDEVVPEDDTEADDENSTAVLLAIGALALAAGAAVAFLLYRIRRDPIDGPPDIG